VRANKCNPFSVTPHFRWQLIPGTVAGTIQLRNQQTGRYVMMRDRRAFIGSLGMRGTTPRHREFKLGTF
jgi:hypothetical protein